MAIFETSTHPQLYVYKVARFVDGRCEVTDPYAVAVMRGLAERGEYGITETGPVHEPGAQSPPGVDGEGSGSGPDDVQRPARSASKADWKAYAITQGMDEADAEKATRDELAAKYADGGGD